MAEPDNLLIFGASTRAAAFSALRAGYRPWCADLFADADLQACCPVQRVPGKQYPRCFVQVARSAPPGPWLYTGALEDAPTVVADLARERPLWGNDVSALELARNPLHAAGLLRERGLPAPRVVPADQLPPAGRWLVKPLRGTAGGSIHFREDAAAALPAGTYGQEYIEGEPCAALYVGSGDGAKLLGVTRQLVGESWLHAKPFSYCGSIGPLAFAPPQVAAFQQVGEVLTAGCQLRGLFGVDGVLRDGAFYPVEINPRYTASVEVLEVATGVAALTLHAAASGGRQPPVGASLTPQTGCLRPPLAGKAILFARAALTFPADGPWLASLRQPCAPWDLPAFADLPHAGDRIEAGRPILTFCAQAETVSDCVERLRSIAADLDGWLFGR